MVCRNNNCQHSFLDAPYTPAVVTYLDNYLVDALKNLNKGEQVKTNKSTSYKFHNSKVLKCNTTDQGEG